MSLLRWLLEPKKIISSATQKRKAVRPPTDTRIRLKGTPYLLPKDTLEDNRLDYQHYVLFLAIGDHYLAPIPQNPERILDVGTGTGIWAIEMARKFSQARVVGVDIGVSSFKKEPPENCKFEFGNVIERLPFPDQTFDYTHQRFLIAAVPAPRWPGVIHELVRVTNPGGWIELLEINNIFQNAGPETTSLNEWIIAVSKSLGFDNSVVPNIETWLKQEGLQFVERQDIVVPLGDWGGRAGMLLKKDLLAGFDATKTIFCGKTNTPIEEFDRRLALVAAEWEEYHTSFTFHAFYGKRVAQ